LNKSVDVYKNTYKFINVYVSKRPSQEVEE